MPSCASAVIAVGAISPLGSGARATWMSGERPRPWQTVKVGATGSRYCALAPVAEVSGPRRAEQLLLVAAAQLAAQLEAVLPGWRELRVLVLAGTSAGPMAEQLALWQAIERGADLSANAAVAALVHAPVEALLAALGLAPGQGLSVFGACASGTIAIGLGHRLLQQGRADVVIAGGYDAINDLVVDGFSALGATSSEPPRPFAASRAGMALSEGAALVAMVPASSAPSGGLGSVLGFGVASDAHHLTAPHPQAVGLLQATYRALAEAELQAPAISLISAHGTATRHNDAAECHALQSLLGEGAASTFVHAMKGVTGHGLAASGALECLALFQGLSAKMAPPSVLFDDLDPAFPCRLAASPEPLPALEALKWSLGFGGINAALVLGNARVASSGIKGATGGTSRALGAGASLRLESRQGPEVLACELERLRSAFVVGVEQLQRADPLSQRAIAAVAELCLSCDWSLGFGQAIAVLWLTQASTLAANLSFDTARRGLDAGSLRPRLFPPTSANTPAAWCSLAFGWTGPCLGLAKSPGALGQEEELASALLEAGDASAVVVVRAEWLTEGVARLFQASGRPPPGPSASARAYRLGGM
jgi:3-oxoacyl-(acyl-carrier-protein) synthase